MRERGVSARALATALGLSNATISNGWLKGAEPRPEQLRALADYFSVSVDAFSPDGVEEKKQGAQRRTSETRLAQLPDIARRVDDLIGELTAIRDKLADIADLDRMSPDHWNSDDAKFPTHMSPDHEEAVRMVLEEEKREAKKKRAS